jgi:Spy/CpxP family protein refolding chaperone
MRYHRRMGTKRATAFVMVALLVGWMTALGCGAKAPSQPVNPLGGPINTGGKPDVDKSHGSVNAGGEPNAGGAPDVNKTQGTVGVGGPRQLGR